MHGVNTGRGPHHWTFTPVPAMAVPYHTNSKAPHGGRMAPSHRSIQLPTTPPVHQGRDCHTNRSCAPRSGVGERLRRFLSHDTAAASAPGRTGARARRAARPVRGGLQRALRRVGRLHRPGAERRVAGLDQEHLGVSGRVGSRIRTPGASSLNRRAFDWLLAVRPAAAPGKPARRRRTCRIVELLY